MLATFVIGLREGLEAAVIVGIIAAFLRKNGRSLLAMSVGVAFAVVLSIAVGVGLELVEQALPQASQEAMESVIGAIAICFVTGMILWMNAHASSMKKALEAEAAEALSQGGAYALAGMAFLAVLREGFETSVFLLATFSAAQSAPLAAAGAIIGLLIAVVIGWGIYIGGVRINLSRFFRFTGAFLILVAAGLVITALRTAHEAGLLQVGQQATVNLSWLVAPGSIQSALITGVLGIPADPRRIEVIFWLAYLVPVTLFVYWPASHRPRGRAAVRLQFTLAVAAGAVAIALAAAFPIPRPQVPDQATIVATDGIVSQKVGIARLNANTQGSPADLMVSVVDLGMSTLKLPESSARREQHDGVAAFVWTVERTDAPATLPATLTLDQVVAFSGGRIPVGLSPAQHPGPYRAAWSVRRSITVWLADGILLDANQRGTAIVSLSGSGLQSPRTLTVRDGDASVAANWTLSAEYRNQAAAELRAVAAARDERLFWAVQLPVALAIAAFVIAVFACRNLRRLRRTPASASPQPFTSAGNRAGQSPRGVTHVAD